MRLACYRETRVYHGEIDLGMYEGGVEETRPNGCEPGGLVDWRIALEFGAVGRFGGICWFVFRQTNAQGLQKVYVV